jgi:hypothetical protein
LKSWQRLLYNYTELNRIDSVKSKITIMPQKHHDKAAQHNEDAAKHHSEPSKHEAQGNHDKGAQHAQAAQGHHQKANKQANRAAGKFAEKSGSMKKEDLEENENAEMENEGQQKKKK